MRIEIDTKNDSKEELIAAIKLLQAALSTKSSPRHQSFNDAEALIDSGLRQSVEQTGDYITNLQALSDPEASDDGARRKEAYVGLFDTPKEIPRTVAEPQKTTQSQTAGLADFFSNITPEQTRQAPMQSVSGKKTDMKPKEKDRTSFFKEFDDEEVDPKVKVVTY